MAEKSSFFTSLNGDRRYKASDFAEYFKTFIGNGVFPNPSTNLQVVANGDMTVTISPGYAWINGYMYANTDNLTLIIENSDSALKRIDRIVVRCDFVNREIKTYIKKGIFSQNPSAPVLTRDTDAYELCIAEIQIDNGVVAIQSSKITDTRLDTEVCGIVTQTINEIDTTALYNQLQAHIQEKSLDMDTWLDETKVYFENDFNTWFEGIKYILDENTAGNLLNEINKLKETINNIELTSSNVKRPDGSTVEDTLSSHKTSILQQGKDISSIQKELGINKETLIANTIEIFNSY